MTNDQIPIARAIATLAHKGQVDKAGKPYIGHPERVAAIVDVGDPLDEDMIAAAWLHDTLEDSFFTADDLLAAGITQDVVDTVVAVTRAPDEQPVDYYNRIKIDGEWAISIKRADIEDNTDPRHLAQLDDATIVRLVKKYAKALALLDGEEG